MNTKELTRASVLIAIVYLSMAAFYFELYGTAIHMGNLVIVVISLTFKRKEAVVAASIGAMLFDLTTKYAMYAPFTFVSRLLLSYIVSLSKDKKIGVQVLYTIIGALVVTFIYFIAFFYFTKNFQSAFVMTVADLYQVAIAIVGVFVAVPIRNAFKSM